MKYCIEIRDLTKKYKNDKGDKIIFENYSENFQKNSLIAITGQSGVGKTTLLNLISGIDLPDSGNIIINGQIMTELNDEERSIFRNRHIGYVVQDYGLIKYKTAIDNVMIPLYFNESSIKDMKPFALNALSRVGIIDLSDYKVGKLSGGQCQRVAIARAIVNNQDILLADEPTNALDDKNKEEILKLFNQLKSEGKTIIVATHDTNIAQCCDCVIDIGNEKA